ALISGLIILPGALLQGLLAPWIGRRYDAVGPTTLVLPGAVLLSTSMWGMAMLTASTPLWLIAFANIGLSLGLALLFTPLLTNGLSALPPHLNSHGSAIVGTVQQVSGAAGIALFISIAAAFGGGGSDEASVTGEGVRAAFTVGAIIATLTIPAVFLVRRTPNTAPVEGQPSTV
ncbi:MAG: MFS transporter, partial [Microcella sp.]|nr:MFS transporter [Microcella sp.]